MLERTLRAGEAGCRSPISRGFEPAEVQRRPLRTDGRLYRVSCVSCALFCVMAPVCLDRADGPSRTRIRNDALQQRVVIRRSVKRLFCSPCTCLIASRPFLPCPSYPRQNLREVG
jgi:hypothetical protein